MRILNNHKNLEAKIGFFFIWAQISCIDQWKSHFYHNLCLVTFFWMAVHAKKDFQISSRHHIHTSKSFVLVILAYRYSSLLFSLKFVRQKRLRAIIDRPTNEILKTGWALFFFLKPSIVVARENLSKFRKSVGALWCKTFEVDVVAVQIVLQ